MATVKSHGTLNGIDTEALQKTMDEVAHDPAKGMARFQVTTSWQGGTRSRTRVERWRLGGQDHPKNFTIDIDEPPQLLGTNSAANPQEYLLAAVNACMMATYVGACAMQGVELESLEIETAGELDLRGFLGIDKNVPPGYEQLSYTARMKCNGTRAQCEAVHNWVMTTSPNFWTMANPIRMNGKLEIV